MSVSIFSVFVNNYTVYGLYVNHVITHFLAPDPDYSCSKAGMSKKRIGSGTSTTVSETLCLFTIRKDISFLMHIAAFNTFLRYACFAVKTYKSWGLLLPAESQ